MGIFRKKDEDADRSKVIVAVLHLFMLIIVVVAVLSLVYMVGKMLEENRKPEVTNAFISSKLETVSDLTTAKMTYNGLIRYEDGEIPILTQKSFFMVYRAEVRAGIDISKIQSSITETEVILYVPKVDIQDIDIDETSIQFYDEKVALFNWTEREDTLDAIAEAKKDVKEKVDFEELNEKAKNQTEILLRGLFEGTIGERELEIQFK